ncbi:hypothetical protein [Tolypothrix sp. VBCCA 56010]|uniref:hypothetical protein n=1 Tax=Tolypothrix sp. VBCCA 56010 TaxID=3137731 RepID=UPI003D7E7CB0
MSLVRSCVTIAGTVIRNGQIAYTIATYIAKVSDDAERANLLETAIAPVRAFEPN